MKPEFITGNQKAEVVSKIKKFGIEKIPFLLIKSGQDKIRAYSGSINADELAKIAEGVFVEIIGLYFARYDGGDLRLSVDALHLLKEQITENIIELTKEQAQDYLKGRDVDLTQEQALLFSDLGNVDLSRISDSPENLLKKQEDFLGKKGYFAIKHTQDFLGMAKIVNGKFIKNYLPKERRRKN